MKDSVIEWCKEIPTSWETKPNKYIMSKRKDICSHYSGEVILSLTMQGIIVRDLDAGGKMPTSFDGYQKVYPGNLLMCLFDYDVTPRCIGLISNKGLTSPAYSQFVLKDNNCARYYYYYYLMIDNTKELLHLTKNLRHSFTEEQIGIIKVPVPPVAEQEKIADFLDEKCAEIDKLSEDIQKQIDILNNYKKSVITRAVTKGLDPNVEMKDSGIEWIGTIPKSWSLIRLKNAAWLKGRIGWQGLRADEFKDDESLPYLITGTDFYDGIVNWDTCVHITEERFNQDRNIQIKEDDLLITKDGTIGKVAIAKKCPQRVSLNSGIFIIRNIGKYKYYSRFMYYVLQSDEFIEWYSVANAGNSTILHLNQEKFYNFVFALPDIESQKYIAERLDIKCAHIDSSISEKYDQLSKLDSYKKSIIYEYVTGKKRVKGEL
ncbi:restriction endonuclease subunit S [Alloprevotella tannerae]